MMPDPFDTTDLLQRLLFLRTRYLGALVRYDPTLLLYRHAIRQEEGLLEDLCATFEGAVREVEMRLLRATIASGTLLGTREENDRWSTIGD
jgi:hypothetical protein